MLHGLSVSAQGMLAQQGRYDILTQNLANIDTAGYRRQTVTFQTVLSRTGEPTTFPTPVSSTDTQSGSVRETGNSTDFSISGNGMFAVKSPLGEVYTRNGAFKLDADGQLVTSEGFTVLGARGPIQITSPDWEVSSNGTVICGGNIIDTLKLVSCPENIPLTRMGNSCWAGSPLPPETGINVKQGSLESSNVNPVTEMIDLLLATRQFEASQKALMAQDAMLEKAVNDVGRV